MRILLIAALGAGLGFAAAPASAQSLNDVGRVLQDQVLGNRVNPDRDREAYEQGRRDQERAHDDARRNEDWRRDQDARRDDGRRYDDVQRHERDIQRQRADQERAWADERRAREQSLRR